MVTVKQIEFVFKQIYKLIKWVFRYCDDNPLKTVPGGASIILGFARYNGRSSTGLATGVLPGAIFSTSASLVTR